MNHSCFFLRGESSIDIIDVGVTAVAIVDIILILGWYEITGGRLVIKSCHSINLIIKDGSITAIITLPL